MSVFNRPKIEIYIGVTGSGKGVSVNARLSELKPQRLLIWDPRNEYSKWAPEFNSLPALIAAVKKAGAGPFKARYVHSTDAALEEAFAIVCNLAFMAGNLLFAAEELSDVTRPSWAPAAWKRVITQGRHQGLQVFGMAQRPALIDKNIFGNATYIRCFMLGYANDRKVMADELDVPPDQVKNLRTTEEIRGDWMHTTVNYIERFKRQGVTKTGQIKLKRKLQPGEAAEAT
jgi:hypothetical protein